MNFTNDQIIAQVFTGNPSWSGIDATTRAFYESHKEAMLAETAAGQRMRNEFYQDLINKIALPRFHDATMRNPLAIFKAENMLLADMTEDIIVAPAKGQSYGQTDGAWTAENEGKGEVVNPFNAQNPDLKASYQSTNRQEKYSVGWKPINLAKSIQAGQNNDLDMLINLIVKSAAEGNTRDEYVFCKRLINSAIVCKDFPLQDSQKVYLDIDLRDPTLKADDISTQMAKVEQTIKNLTYNNSGFNAQKVERAVSLDSMRLIAHKDAITTEKFKSLAFIYNPNFQKSGLSNVVEVDNFGEGNEDIIFVVADNQALRYHDKQNTLDSIYNPATSRMNVWHLVQQIYTYNPAGQMIVFYAPKKTPTPNKAK